MMNDIRLYKALRTKLGDSESEELVSFVKAEIQNGFMEKKDSFLVKEDKLELVMLMQKDKTDILKTIYFVGLVQYLAIMASLVAILKFMLGR